MMTPTKDDKELKKMIEAFWASNQDFKVDANEKIEQQIIDRIEKSRGILTYEEAQQEVMARNEQRYYAGIESTVEQQADGGHLFELVQFVLQLKQKYPRSINTLRLAKDVESAIDRYLQEKRKLSVEEKQQEQREHATENKQDCGC